MENDGDVLFEEAQGAEASQDAGPEGSDFLIFGDETEETSPENSDAVEADSDEGEGSERRVPYHKLEAVSRTNQSLKKEIEGLRKQVEAATVRPNYSEQLSELECDSLEKALSNAQRDKKFLDFIDQNINRPEIAAAVSIIKKEINMGTEKDSGGGNKMDPQLDKVMKTIQAERRGKMQEHLQDLTKDWTPAARKAIVPAVAGAFDYSSEVTKAIAANAVRDFCKANGITKKEVELSQGGSPGKVKTRPGAASTKPEAPKSKVKDDKPAEPRFKTNAEWAAHARAKIREGAESLED